METAVFLILAGMFAMLGLGYLMMRGAAQKFVSSRLRSGQGRAVTLAERSMAQAALARTELAQRNRELNALAERLDLSAQELSRLNAMKSKFLSMVVHDVRTPLAAIRGYSELFSAGAASERQKKMSQNMVTAVDRLNLLVSDLTDVAMIEAGKLTMAKTRFRFGTLISELMPSIEINAANRGVALRYDRITPDAELEGDKFRLSQVLQNFLNNAIKFTPKGGLVEVSSRLEGRWLLVNVKDSGIGVHPSETKKIFEKFYQAKYQKDEKLRKQGWGLGLSIAHEIVMQHKGEIGATSAGLGKGSTFWFKVPLPH